MTWKLGIPRPSCEWRVSLTCSLKGHYHVTLHSHTMMKGELLKDWTAHMHNQFLVKNEKKKIPTEIPVLCLHSYVGYQGNAAWIGLGGSPLSFGISENHRLQNLAPPQYRWGAFYRKLGLTSLFQNILNSPPKKYVSSSKSSLAAHNFLHFSCFSEYPLLEINILVLYSILFTIKTLTFYKSKRRPKYKVLQLKTDITLLHYIHYRISSHTRPLESKKRWQIHFPCYLEKNKNLKSCVVNWPSGYNISWYIAKVLFYDTLF